MHIFISAGEPSGDLHGSNLVRSLRLLHPDVRCVGFGGERMESAGCTLLYPLCRLAVMWFLRVLLNAGTFVRLLVRADRYFRDERPDAVVLIDYPGFHWWLAWRAKKRGIPVFYFVPPQLWGWAGWRVNKMRRSVAHVLCALPFEEKWYRDRNVPAHYVGHPYFDELHRQRLDPAFVAEQQSWPGQALAILPGSRRQEVTSNFPMLLKAAECVHAARPDVRFVVASFNEIQAEIVREHLRGRVLPVEVHVGRTPEVIASATMCLAVSGSVGLEMLFRLKPAVVAYRIGRLDLKVCNFFKTSPFISLVNLLADEELYPEFLTDHCEAERIAARVLAWLNDPTAAAELAGKLERLRDRVAEPGACDRAARFVLERLAGVGVPRQAA